MSDEMDNPSRLFIADAIANGHKDVPLNVNPALESAQAVLVEGAPGDVTVSFVAGEQDVQGNGVIHGGTIASMLDSGMAIATLSALKPGQTCTTISLTVNFMRPARLGKLFVRATVEKMGGRVAFVNAKIFGEDQKQVGSATSSLAVIGIS